MSRMHVRVRAGNEHYALPVRGVREVAKLAEITPVPGAPAAVLGVWNLRGDVIAALDLATLLGLGDTEPGRIVVVEEGGLHGGLAVESVLDVGAIPEPLEPTESEYLLGAVLVERVPVGVIDLGAVLGAVSTGADR
jgi:purine-binding chemotaxis protein CheW